MTSPDIIFALQVSLSLYTYSSDYDWIMYPVTQQQSLSVTLSPTDSSSPITDHGFGAWPSAEVQVYQGQGRVPYEQPRDVPCFAQSCTQQ